MTFIVILMALLIERFFDWSHIRHWSWFANYERKIANYLPKKSPYVVILSVVIPLIIVVGLIQLLLDNVLYGFLKLLFELFVLIYCLGPQNLWADIFSCISNGSAADGQLLADKLKFTFGLSDSSNDWHQKLVNQIFIEANRRVFAVIFWFVVLGPLGAVLYRSLTEFFPEVSKKEVAPELTQAAHTWVNVLDWLPVRIFTFLFALGGHFVQVFSCWRKMVFQGLSSNEAMLVDCGMAAIGTAQDGLQEKNAISLLDRAFVIVLVIIAVSVLLF